MSEEIKKVETEKIEKSTTKDSDEPELLEKSSTTDLVEEPELLEDEEDEEDFDKENPSFADLLSGKYVICYFL